MVEIVPLREGPKLNDLPAVMREVAGQIERGEIPATSALFVVPVEHDWPIVFGWGEHLSDYGNIAVLELAKAWFVQNLTART